MLSTKRCQKIQPKFKNFSKEKDFFEVIIGSNINNIVEKRTKVLQCKYNLSDEQIDEIVNSLYCISENIIKANIEKQIVEIKKNEKR